MEVHPHTHSERKKWTHYLWEFLMLFLAVFCGFLAELQVEHKVEKTKEKEYIRSMIEDLEKDTANFSIVIKGFTKMENRFDTVLTGFDSGILCYFPRWAYNFILTIKGGYPDFFYTDRTLQQLKNSGGLRLIQKENAANGIVEYDAGIKDLNVEETTLSLSQENYIQEAYKVWSLRKMYKDNNMLAWIDSYNVVPAKNYWITNEEKSFEQLYNRLAYYSEATRRQKRFFIAMQKHAANLVELLKREYHLK